jgi:hypothetical protein
MSPNQQIRARSRIIETGSRHSRWKIARAASRILEYLKKASRDSSDMRSIALVRRPAVRDPEE